MGVGKNINFKNEVVKLRSSLTRKYYFKEFKVNYDVNTFQSSLAISIAESKLKIYFQFCWLPGNSGMQSIVFNET